MNSKESIIEKMWSRQQISSRDVDYDFWDQKRSLIQQMAGISHSCLFTVDVFRKSYDFASLSFSDLFGYKTDWLNAIGNRENFLEEMTHPDDREKLMDMQINHAHFIYGLDPRCRNDYSTIYTFRLRHAQYHYLNVISRQKVIQSDAHGKAWIILGEVNILPDQSPARGVWGMTVNLKTGRMRNIQPPAINESGLSERELEVLRLILAGRFSKEIADRLYISIHTVNNHRKNILRKLQAANSAEAINIARMKGYLE